LLSAVQRRRTRPKPFGRKKGDINTDEMCRRGDW
jgi:hypothetical protein